MKKILFTTSFSFIKDGRYRMIKEGGISDSIFQNIYSDILSNQTEIYFCKNEPTEILPFLENLQNSRMVSEEEMKNIAYKEISKSECMKLIDEETLIYLLAENNEEPSGILFQRD